MLKYDRQNLGRYGVLGAVLAVALILLLWLLQIGRQLFSLFIPFLLSIILAYILNPLVEFLEDRRVPRSLGILLIYAVFFSFVFLFGVTAIPALISELQKLGEMLPQYTGQFQDFLFSLQTDYRRINLPESIRMALDQNLLSLQAAIQNVLERVTGSVLSLFSNLLAILIIPLMVYYFLRDMDALKRSLVLLFPKKYRSWFVSMGSEMDRTLGAYFRGILVISFLVAVLTYVGLALVGLDYALILGILAGLTNVIPYFGPIIGAIPAVLLALLTSPALALKAGLVYVVVQQLESQIITPQVLGRSLGLHPLVVIFVLILGGKLYGLPGLIFAVPFTAIIRIFLKHVIDFTANRNSR
ncbi:MAG: AI-2E family transporter [Firmicutes bacterium]|nr:AI-2E family transporter [Bacillota bacterium]